MGPTAKYLVGTLKGIRVWRNVQVVISNDEELDAVCLDPRARIRQFYDLEQADEGHEEHEAHEASEPEASAGEGSP